MDGQHVPFVSILIGECQSRDTNATFVDLVLYQELVPVFLCSFAGFNERVQKALILSILFLLLFGFLVVPLFLSYLLFCRSNHWLLFCRSNLWLLLQISTVNTFLKWLFLLKCWFIAICLRLNTYRSADQLLIKLSVVSALCSLFTELFEELADCFIFFHATRLKLIAFCPQRCYKLPHKYLLLSLLRAMIGIIFEWRLIISLVHVPSHYWCSKFSHRLIVVLGLLLYHDWLWLVLFKVWVVPRCLINCHNALFLSLLYRSCLLFLYHLWCDFYHF